MVNLKRLISVKKSRYKSQIILSVRNSPKEATKLNDNMEKSFLLPTGTVHVKITMKSSFTDNSLRLHGQVELMGITTALSTPNAFAFLFT